MELSIELFKLMHFNCIKKNKINNIILFLSRLLVKMEQCIFKNKNCGIHKLSRDPRLLFSINELDKNCKNHLVSIKIL